MPSHWPLLRIKYSPVDVTPQSLGWAPAGAVEEPELCVTLQGMRGLGSSSKALELLVGDPWDVRSSAGKEFVLLSKCLPNVDAVYAFQA